MDRWQHTGPYVEGNCIHITKWDKGKLQLLGYVALLCCFDEMIGWYDDVMMWWMKFSILTIPSSAFFVSLNECHETLYLPPCYYTFSSIILIRLWIYFDKYSHLYQLHAHIQTYMYVPSVACLSNSPKRARAVVTAVVRIPSTSTPLHGSMIGTGVISVYRCPSAPQVWFGLYCMQAICIPILSKHQW